MRIITEPTVVLVAKPEFLGHPDFELPEDGTGAERLGAFSAKACYRSYGKDGRSVVENQKHIVSSRHGRILEHSNITLSISGITRALSLELMTHKHLTCSQESTRYVDMKTSGIVLEPYYAELLKKYNITKRLIGYTNFNPDYKWLPDHSLTWNTEKEFNEQAMLLTFIKSCENSFDEYENQLILLEKLNPLNLKGTDLRKWCRGKARNVLCHALETHMVVTGDFRAWRIFIESRSSRWAESEIRRLTNIVFDIIRPIAPIYFEDFQNTGTFEGAIEWTPTYSKV